MRRRAIRARRATILALVALGALLPTAAEAEPVIVGSPLEGDFTSARAIAEGTYFNTALPEPGAHIVSPIDGAIVNVHLIGAEGGPYRVRVLSPDGGSSYTARAASHPIVLDAEGKGQSQTLAIEAGDTVGLDIPKDGKLAGLREAGPEAAYAFWIPPLGGGSSLPYNGTKTGFELGFNATVLPRPTVSAVGPRSVDRGKRVKVKIRGTDFARVLKVSFGRFFPRSWRVVNENLIVATTHPLSKEARVHVRVQTVAGTSAATRRSLLEFRQPNG